MSALTVAALDRARHLITARRVITSATATDAEVLTAARWLAEHAPAHADRMTGKMLAQTIEART